MEFRALAKLEHILKLVGQRIAYYRKQKGLNQSQLANLLDKDRQVIQRLETGKVNPTVKTLHELAEVLDIELTDLLIK